MKIAKLREQESCSTLVFPCGNNRSRDDLRELLTFIKQFAHAVLRQKLCLNNELNPAATLAQFLQTDCKLVNKVSATLSSARFLIIGCRRRTTAYELSGNMA